MNLYSHDFDTFYDNVKKFDVKKDKLELFKYKSEKEQETLIEMIEMIQKDGEKYDELVESLHYIIEVEILFSKIYNDDDNIMLKKIKELDINEVQGISLIHEFIKILQHELNRLPANTDDKILENIADLDQLSLIKMFLNCLRVKYNKTLASAQAHVDTFLKSDMMNYEGIDKESTINQCDNFLNQFR